MLKGAIKFFIVYDIDACRLMHSREFHMQAINLNKNELRQSIRDLLKDWNRNQCAPDLLDQLLFVRKIADGSTTQSKEHRQNAKEALLYCLNVLKNENQIFAEIIELRYLENNSIKKLVIHFNQTRDEYLYKQRKAISSLRDILIRKEFEVREEQVHQIKSLLEPKTYNQLFGVEKHLEHLKHLISAPVAPWMISLVGIGGIGKTSLANETIRELLNAFCFDRIIWIKFSSANTLNHQTPQMKLDEIVLQLAQHLCPSMQKTVSLPVKIRQIRRILKEAPHLIVIDNLEQKEEIEHLLTNLKDFTNPSKFLFTTRTHPSIELSNYNFVLPELDYVASSELIQEHAKTIGLQDLVSTKSADTKLIYESVGGNPLALKIITGTAMFMPLDEILESLKTVESHQVEKLYHHIYMQAWNSLGTHSKKVLSVMPLAGDNGIEFNHLKNISQVSDAHFLSAITELIKRSLLEANGTMQIKRYSIHRLTESFLLSNIVNEA